MGIAKRSARRRFRSIAASSPLFLALRTAMSRAVASHQGCSPAIASGSPPRGPESVFEKKEDMKEQQACRSDPDKEQVSCKSSRSIPAR